jgi:hypothetical protein
LALLLPPSSLSSFPPPSLSSFLSLDVLFATECHYLQVPHSPQSLWQPRKSQVTAGHFIEVLPQRVGARAPCAAFLRWDTGVRAQQNGTASHCCVNPSLEGS